MLTILLFLILSALIALTAVVTRHAFGPTLWVVSPSFIFSAYFALIALGGVTLNSTEPGGVTALLGHIAWFLGMIASIILTAPLMRRSATQLQTFALHHRLAAMTFIGLGFASVMLTFAMYERVPLLIGIKSALGEGGEISMHAARRMNTISHRSGDTTYFGQGYLRTIYTVVAPIFVFATYCYGALAKGTIRPGPIMSVTILAFFIFAIANGQIWLGAIYLMLAFCVAVFIHTTMKGRAPFANLAAQTAAAYIAMIAIVFLYRHLQVIGGRVVSGTVFQTTIERIYSYPQSVLFDIFPKYLPFRYGSTWWNDISGILPGSQQSFAYEVHYLVHGGGWGFTLSPGVVASSYVNFGFVGCFATALISTSFFSIAFGRLISSANPVAVVSAIFLSLRFAYGVQSDVGSYFTDGLTIILLLASYFILSEIYRIFLVSPSRRKILRSTD